MQFLALVVQSRGLVISDEHRLLIGKGSVQNVLHQNLWDSHKIRIWIFWFSLELNRSWLNFAKASRNTRKHMRSGVVSDTRTIGELDLGKNFVSDSPTRKHIFIWRYAFESNVLVIILQWPYSRFYVIHLFIAQLDIEKRLIFRLLTSQVTRGNQDNVLLKQTQDKTNRKKIKEPLYSSWVWDLSCLWSWLWMLD